MEEVHAGLEILTTEALKLLLFFKTGGRTLFNVDG
jgi:hypothetical protein